MEEKKQYNGVFARGWSRLLKERYRLNTSQLLRIARSGGTGLPIGSVEIYKYLWANRLDVFRPDYLATFEQNDKRNNKVDGNAEGGDQ